MRRLPIIVGVVIALLIVGLSSVYIVDERKQALVLQFGQVKQVRIEPGLFLKLPFIQNVVYYEGRILPLDTEPLEVIPLDERRLVVDAFARWRITDPVEFRQAVQTEAAGADRLDGILNASIRQVLGSVPSQDVLSPERTVLMTRIRDAARASAKGLGIEIIDVRIRRADLPEQNLTATFERMQTEREREAADERARGKERGQEIRATADRQAVELVSDAERQAAIIRGQADAERSRIYAEAFGQDPEFFAFYRSLEAYKNALTGENSTLVITPDSEFFEYLKSDRLSPETVDVEPVPPTAALPAPQAGGTDLAEPGAEAAPGPRTSSSEAEVIVLPATSGDEAGGDGTDAEEETGIRQEALYATGANVPEPADVPADGAEPEPAVPIAAEPAEAETDNVQPVR